MLFDKNIKYRDILIFGLVGLIGYKLIDNYQIAFDFISKLMSICAPFIYALLFAYILNPIMKMFEKQFKIKRGAAIGITYTIICLIVVVVSIYVVPSIIDSIISITTEIPRYMEITQSWINELLKNQNIYEMISDVGMLDHIGVISTKVGAILVGLLEGSVSSILAFTANLVKVILGLLISIYVLLDKEKLIRGTKMITYMVLKGKNGDRLISVVRTYHNMVGVYIGTKALDSLIIGLIALVGLFILKAPYAILIAIIVGFTNMIPYFGPFVGELVGAGIGIFVSPAMAITIFLFLLALQQFDAWYLDPKLIGAKVGVRPFILILAITIGGGFFGPIGMLLASPTMATINIFYHKRVDKFKRENKEMVNKIEEVGLPEEVIKNEKTVEKINK